MAYLQLSGITKRFGSVIANDAIDLSVEAGSIHALLGENGAGKSTLMNVLSGLYSPDAGEIYLNQQPVQITSPSVAKQYGIGMIHQHFMLVPSLTVAENIVLGSGPMRLKLAQQAAAIEATAQSYGLAVPVQARVEDLPVGVQQRVEILKVLYHRAKLLILDEPTAVLTPEEVQGLIQILKQLAADGHTILFISHKLEEVMALCDRVTVLRQGKVVATVATAETTSSDLAELMVGHSVAVNARPPAADLGETVLNVTNLSVQNARGLPAVRNLSFELRRGEILGIAGVDGNGQRELADALAGLATPTQGEIDIPDAQQPDFKLGYIPEDRQKMGLILSFSIARNLILKLFWQIPFCRRWLLQQQQILNYADQAQQQFDIRAAHSQLTAGQLSGGNQQKIVLARELSGEPLLIIAMQPTRGLDVGAAAAVQTALLEQRQRGAAILYISTELEEVMAISDRVAVLYQGQFMDILPAATATRQQVGLLMAGRRPEPAAAPV